MSSKKDFKFVISKDWINYAVKYCITNNIDFTCNTDIADTNQCDFVIKDSYTYQLLFLGIEIGKEINQERYKNE